MTKRIISISVDPALVHEIDWHRGTMPRSQFIERVVDAALHPRDKDRKREVLVGYG